MKKSSAHPTAEDVYASLKQENPRLSLGTVYRNLSQLAERGEINRLKMPNGGDRFDGKMWFVLKEEVFYG